MTILIFLGTGKVIEHEGDGRAGSFPTARNSHILKAPKRRITMNNFIYLSAILFLVGPFYQRAKCEKEKELYNYRKQPIEKDKK